jgi:hypothetical protein
VVAWSVRFVNPVRNGNPRAQPFPQVASELCSEDRYKHRVDPVHHVRLIETLLAQDCRWRIALRAVGGEGPRRCSDGLLLGHVLLPRLRSTILQLLLGDQLAEEFPASARSR